MRAVGRSRTERASRRSGPTLRARGGEMDQALGPFLGSWTVMMAAMMLPSAMPMILLHRRGVAGAGPIRSGLRTGIFVGAYLLVWAAAGVVVWLGARITDALLPMGARPLAVA